MGPYLWYVAPRFAVLIAGLLTYRVLKGVGVESSASIPAMVLRFLLFRDLLYLFFPHRTVLILGDIVVLFLYILWLERNLGRREASRPGLVVLAVCAILVGLFDLHGSLSYGTLLYLLIMAGALALTAVSFFDATTDSVETSRSINDTRDIVVLGSLYCQAAIFAFGHSAPLTQALLYPLSYLIHLAVLLLYFRRSHTAGLEAAKQAEDEKERLFGFMHRVETAISEHVELDQILEYVVEDAMIETGADAGAVFLRSDNAGELRLRAQRGGFPPPYAVSGTVKERASRLDAYLRSTPIAMGETVLGVAAETGKAIFIPIAERDSRLAANHDPEDSCFISSLIAVPLSVSGEVLGVLSIVRTKSRRPFSKPDFLHLQTFADYAALSIEMMVAYLNALERKAIESEVGLASAIQQRLVAGRRLELPGLRPAVFSQAARGVSGDYYDYAEIDEATVALLICDVAGKGIPASLVMVMIHTLFDSLATSSADPAATLAAINSGIARKTAVEHYATMAICHLDRSNGRLSYANAAHHPLMLYRAADNDIEYLDTPGLPVGIDPDMIYAVVETQLQAGDAIVLYTDGITEAMDADGAEFGKERLEALVRAFAARGATVLLQSICAAIAEFVGSAKQHDDQTLLVLEFRPETDDT